MIIDQSKMELELFLRKQLTAENKSKKQRQKASCWFLNTTLSYETFGLKDRNYMLENLTLS